MRVTQLRARRRSRGAQISAVFLIALSACLEATSQPSDTSKRGGLEIPESPYPPFPYVSEVERDAYTSFIECSRRHGVTLEGPFADSRGEGALLRLAPGEHASFAKQKKVNQRCPEFFVALATTPSPMVSQRSFRKAMVAFARCLRSHGLPHLALPKFGDPDPYDGLVFPLDWERQRLRRAARSCVDGLERAMLG